MTSTSGPQTGAGAAAAGRPDPVPLFDLVTGFPPDDAFDVTVPIPLSLSIYMTMLESTGHAAELAVLRRIHIEEARETARSIQAALDLPEPARLRVTHIVDERVPGVNGLRPHVHAFVGPVPRCPGGDPPAPVGFDRLVAVTDAIVLPDHRERLATATAERCGLVWSDAGPAGREVVEPPWLVESTARARTDEPPCAGPWPRRQIVAGGSR